MREYACTVRVCMYICMWLYVGVKYFYYITHQFQLSPVNIRQEISLFFYIYIDNS